MADRLETVTNTLLSHLTNLAVIRANQDDAPRPKLPYATYQINARTTIGSDDYGWLDNSGIMLIKGTREGTILVNFFGENAREYADDLVNTIRKTTSHYLMRRLGLVISNTGTVNDMTGLRDDNRYEQMANVDLSFRYTIRYTDDVGLIEKVSAEETIGSIKINHTIKGQ